MSKKYKVKQNKEKIEENNGTTLSKKELYDLKQKEKKENQAKNNKKKKTKKKNSKKTYKTNLVGRIFAIIMLILMLGSVIATISYSFR